MALTRNRYETIAAAIDDVVEAVVKRIDPDSAEANNLRSFLYTMIADAPDIKEDLRRLLAIENSDE